MIHPKDLTDGQRKQLIRDCALASNKKQRELSTQPPTGLGGNYYCKTRICLCSIYSHPLSGKDMKTVDVCDTCYNSEEFADQRMEMERALSNH